MVNMFVYIGMMLLLSAGTGSQRLLNIVFFTKKNLISFGLLELLYFLKDGVGWIMKFL